MEVGTPDSIFLHTSFLESCLFTQAPTHPSASAGGLHSFCAGELAWNANQPVPHLSGCRLKKKGQQTAGSQRKHGQIDIEWLIGPLGVLDRTKFSELHRLVAPVSASVALSSELIISMSAWKSSISTMPRKSYRWYQIVFNQKTEDVTAAEGLLHIDSRLIYNLRQIS